MGTGPLRLLCDKSLFTEYDVISTKRLPGLTDDYDNENHAIIMPAFAVKKLTIHATKKWK